MKLRPNSRGDSVRSEQITTRVGPIPPNMEAIREGISDAARIYAFKASKSSELQ